jgi:hypothetical protein
VAAVHFHTLLCSRAAKGAGPGARRNEAQHPAAAASRTSPTRRQLMQANPAAEESNVTLEEGPSPAFKISRVTGARIFVGGSSSPIAITATVQVPEVVPDYFNVDWPPRRAWIIYEPGARMIGLQGE